MHNDDYSGLHMMLTYETVKRFDDRLKRIEAGVRVLLAHGSVEAELRAEIAALIEAAAMDQAAKEALQAKVAAVLARSETVEARLRSVVPNAT